MNSFWHNQEVIKKNIMFGQISGRGSDQELFSAICIYNKRQEAVNNYNHLYPED